MTKQGNKKTKKPKRSLKLDEVMLLEAQHAMRLSYLKAQEVAFERKVRNKALRMARKRKIEYIQ